MSGRLEIYKRHCVVRQPRWTIDRGWLAIKLRPKWRPGLRACPESNISPYPCLSERKKTNKNGWSWTGSISVTWYEQITDARRVVDHRGHNFFFFLSISSFLRPVRLAGSNCSFAWLPVSEGPSGWSVVAPTGSGERERLTLVTQVANTCPHYLSPFSLFSTLFLLAFAATSSKRLWLYIIRLGSYRNCSLFCRSPCVCACVRCLSVQTFFFFFLFEFFKTLSMTS